MMRSWPIGGPIGDSSSSSSAGPNARPSNERPRSQSLRDPKAADPALSGGLAGTPAPPPQPAATPRDLNHTGLEGLPELHLLVVDDDEAVLNACLEIAGKMGFAVVGAHDLDSARAILKHQKLDLVLLDLKLPGVKAGTDGASGLSLLEEIKSLNPETVVIVMTAFATISSAVEAMRIGAGDYLTKPFALEELVTVLERAGERRHFDLESRRLREKLRQHKGTGHLIGHSPEMEKLYRILSKVAGSNHPVLILGESGTGKELVARSIHFNGPWAQKRFVPVDCGSLAPGLIESELFGHVKGAFAGAIRNREGLLAAADGGTVFLDEIAELPLDLQAKLLRALQERAVRPVGATASVPINVRVLAATNRDLAVLVEQGKFRKDLFFRLNVVSLRIPPLRDRREDIPVLAQHFLERTQRARPASPIPFPTTPCAPCSPTTGRATSASSKTPSSAPAPSPPGPCCTWATCPRSCTSSACRTVPASLSPATCRRLLRPANRVSFPSPRWSARPFSKPSASSRATS